MLKIRLLSCLVAFCLLFAIIPTTALASDTVLGEGYLPNNLYWKLDSDGTLTISGNGDMYNGFDLMQNFPPWWDIRLQITSIIIEPGVTSIAQSAFDDATNVKSVTLSDTVAIISKYAFYGCAIETLRIPKSVSKIDGRAFICPALKYIEVDPENKYFSSDETGVLYNKDKTSLLLFPPMLSGSYVIPDSVTYIERFINTGLTKLTVGKNVPNRHGIQCPNLETITYNNTDSIVSDCGSEKLKNIIIGENPSAISGWQYIDKSVLIEIDEDNQNYCVVDNVVYNKEKNEIYYAHESVSGTFTVPEGVSTIKNSAFKNCTNITSVILPETVTAIGENAFEGCTSLNNIKFSDALTVIKKSTFENCTSLTNIILPDSISYTEPRAFAGCTALETVTGPACRYGEQSFLNCSSLKAIPAISDGKIQSGTFSGCTSLTNITIDFEEAYILGGAFANCTGLKEVRFTGDYTYIDSTAFNNVNATCYYPLHFLKWQNALSSYGGNLAWRGEIINEFENEEYTYSIPDTNVILGYSINSSDKTCAITLCNKDAKGNITIPETINGYTVIEIKDSAFSRCIGITGITLPDTITVIGDEAFSGCYGIKSIHLPENLAVIGAYAFRQLTVNTLTFPEGVTTIGDGAFMNSGIDTVVLPDSLTYIPNSMFENSYYLHRVDFPAMIKSVGKRAFYGCYELYSVVLPEGLEVIEESAFHACGPSTSYGMYYEAHHFTSVTLPSTVKSIKTSAFALCQALSTINLPEGLTEIGDGAFYNCNSLGAITIPSTVKSLAKNTFASCPGLKNITFRWNAPQFDANVFTTNVTATCYYPNNNETWTSDLFQNYGASKLTWVAMDMEAPEGAGGNGNEGSGDQNGNNGSDSEDGNEQGGGDNSGSDYDGNGGSGSNEGNNQGGNGSGSDNGGNSDPIVPPVEPEIPDVPVEPEVPSASLEDKLKEALGSAFEDTKLDFDIEAPLSYKAGDEITVSVTVKNITAENGIHIVEFKLFYDNEKLLLTNDIDEESDNALQCVTVLPNGWENLSKVANDFDPDNEEGTEVKPLNDGVITAVALTEKTTKTAAIKADGSLVFEFTFKALEDSEGDLGFVIPHATTEGAFNNKTGETIYKANGDYAITHQATVLNGYAPDCVTEGLTDGLYCPECDKNIVEQEIIASLGHDLVHHDAKAPTCTEIGWKEYDTCSRCDYTTYVELEALDHDLVHHDAKAPTCTEIGWDAYDTCSRCDYTTYVELEALDHDLVHHDAKAPTCTEIGWKEYDTCSRCDYTTYVELEALDHDLVHHDAKAPTCTEIGWKEYDTCSRCDYTTYVELEALDHDLVHHDAKAPTCTEIGWKEYDTCSRCDYTTYVELEALGHDLVHHDAKAPTCTEIGWDAYDTCSRCDYTTYIELEALGHDLVHHDAKAPTCTEIGWKEYDTCSRCDYTTYVELEALDHDLVHHDAKAPTCTEIGWKEYDTCSRCDYTTYVELEALGHDLVHHDAKAPTCTEIGWDAYDTCSRCDYTTYVELEALDHDLVHHDAKAPTCTEIGWKEYDTCSRCDYTTYVELEALGHDHKATVTAPTCTEKGFTTYTCHCGDSYVDDYVDALGHDDGEWITAIEPDVGKDGLSERRCTACGELLETKVIPMLCMLGDINGRNGIDKYDYVAVKRAFMATLELTDVQKKAADINGNGVIDKYDYVLLKRHVMGTYVIG